MWNETERRRDGEVAGNRRKACVLLGILPVLRVLRVLPTGESGPIPTAEPDQRAQLPGEYHAVPPQGSSAALPVLHKTGLPLVGLNAAATTAVAPKQK